MSKTKMQQINARIQKWREMIDKDMFSQETIVKHRVRKGIPSGIRMLAWPKMIGLQPFKKQAKYNYSSLINQSSACQAQIQQDISRMKLIEFDMLKKPIFNVLNAISLVYPQIGYCQGMNYLAMKLLQILDDQTAFWILSFIIHKTESVSNVLKNSNYAQVQNQVLSQLIKKHLSSVSSILIEQKISTSLYSLEWFVTLFSTLLPSETFFRVFQCFLIQGYKIIYRAALACLKLKSQQILLNSAEVNLRYLTEHSFYNDIKPQIFIETMFSFSISKSTIKNLEIQHIKSHKISMKKIELQNILKLERRIKKVEKRNQEIADEQIDPIKINNTQARILLPTLMQEYKELDHEIIQSEPLFLLKTQNSQYKMAYQQFSQYYSNKPKVNHNL